MHSLPAPSLSVLGLNSSWSMDRGRVSALRGPFIILAILIESGDPVPCDVPLPIFMFNGDADFIPPLDMAC